MLRLLAAEKAKDGCLKDALSSLVAESALTGSEMDALAKKLNKIPIVTVHQSKGCEFDSVILAGADGFHFPLAGAEESGREEEEKRVFYVAITRPKKSLLLTCRRTENSRRGPTPYLFLLPEELVERYISDGKHTEKI